MSNIVKYLVDGEDPIIIVVSSDEQRLRGAIGDIVDMSGENTVVVSGDLSEVPTIFKQRSQDSVSEPDVVVTKIAGIKDFGSYDFIHFDRIGDEGSDCGVTAVVGIISDSRSVDLANDEEGLVKRVLARSSLYDVEFAEKLIKANS